MMNQKDLQTGLFARLNIMQKLLILEWVKSSKILLDFELR